MIISNNASDRDAKTPDAYSAIIAKASDLPPIPPSELQNGAQDVTQALLPEGIYFDTVAAVSFRMEDGKDTVVDVTHVFFDGNRSITLTNSSFLSANRPIPKAGDTSIVVFAYDEVGHGEVVLHNDDLFNGLLTFQSSNG